MAFDPVSNRKYTTASATNDSGQLIFSASLFLNLLTETEMCAFFRSSTQIIADTALLMSRRDSEVNVESTRFNEVMTACVAEDIFTADRVAAFKRGIRFMSQEEM